MWILELEVPCGLEGGMLYNTFKHRLKTEFALSKSQVASHNATNPFVFCDFLLTLLSVTPIRFLLDFMRIGGVRKVNPLIKVAPLVVESRSDFSFIISYDFPVPYLCELEKLEVPCEENWSRCLWLTHSNAK